MTARGTRMLAFALLGVSIALSLGAAIYLVKGWSIPMLPTEFGVKGDSAVFALVVGALGTIIALRQPRNAIGWIFYGVGISSGVLAFSAAYGRWAVIGQAGRPIGALWAAGLQEWIWIPTVGGLALVATIFPDGRFLSRGWRLATWFAIAATVAASCLAAITPKLTVYVGYPNPAAVGSSSMAAISQSAVGLTLPLVVIGAISTIVRFRRSRGEERLQIKWLALSVTMMAVLVSIYGAGQVLLGTGSSVNENKVLEYLAIIAFLGIPVSIAFGVLKYRLYDIDVVITKAVVYGALAAFITLVYVGVVVGIGTVIGTESNAFLSAVAAAIVALAFQPVRRRANGLANRIVYGERATPYQVLADLGDRLAGEYAVDDVLDRLASTLAAGIGADQAVVWLHVGSELRPAGSWPPGAELHPIALVDGAMPGGLGAGGYAALVRHRGETIGAISVRKPASDPVTPADERLLGDLCGQAGLVLHNVRLIEDLRASRQRLVAAQDDERRRIERNIHDGAQQQLVALAVKIRLTDGVVGSDDQKAHALLAQLQSDASQALEDLRDLAHGIYPPLLADKGLASALEAQARRAAVPVHVSHDGIDRYPPDAEAAVYFCVLEALQNIGKYANATNVELSLDGSNGVLRFSVRDDGIGFDADRGHGAGLTNMRDRLDALGGTLTVDSTPGHGTTISGTVPANPSSGAEPAVS